MKRQLFKLSLVAGVLALFVPAVASAQNWPDYRRDRDNGRYDNRYVRDSIQRLDRLAKDFEREVDRDLDHNRRVNGSRREDQINNLVHDFRRAAGDFKSRVGNGRDLNRSYDEARRVVQVGDAVERQARPRWFDSRLSSEWSQIRRELQTIENIYGIRGSRGRNDDIYRDRRNDDIYRDRRNDDIYRDRNRSNNDWLRRLPFPLPY